MERSKSRRGCTTLLLGVALVTIFVAPTTAYFSILPHDTHPGYGIKKVSSNDSRNDLNFRILNAEYSEFFTVLDNGLVMTTSDLSPLINRPLNLIVVEETEDSTSTHMLPMMVLDRRDMLKFKADVLHANGEVSENAPAGTKVDNVPIVLATSIFGTTPVIYSFISGNEDGAFAFQDSVDLVVRKNISVNYPNKGVWLVTAKPLDRENKEYYALKIQATDENAIKKSVAQINVKVLNENDNAPIFLQKVYRFIVNGTRVLDYSGNETITWKRFTSIGHVEAFDPDGDKVAYNLASHSNLVIIVPQTGEILLTGEPDEPEVEFKVEVHDVATPPLKSKLSAKVFVTFAVPPKIDDEKLDFSNDILLNTHHHREKRRVTRAVRPTKRIEFTEADGETEGRNVFQLEKETDRETFKIRDDNVWVTVESSGVVKVKKKWDFEELGPEKTIDFWVTITNAGNGGELFFLNTYTYI